MKEEEKPEPGSGSGPDPGPGPDPLIGWLANLDQARKASEDVAELITHYFHALVRNGMKRWEALALTRDYAIRMFGGPGGDPGG